MRKRADTTCIKKLLQDFASDFEKMKNKSVDAKAYRNNGFLHTAL